MPPCGIGLPLYLAGRRCPIRLGWVAVALLGLVAAACTDNHSVSPWGDAGRPRLADYAVRPDLDARVAEIEAEASQLGMDEAFRLQVKDPNSGDALVAMGLRGRDEIGRDLTATRVVSKWGVVLARGPLDMRDVRRSTATELLQVVSVGATTGGADGGPDAPGGFGAFSDLTRDGTPDLVLRSEQGRIEIWSMTSRAGTQVEVRMEVTPSRFVDVDGDGRVDLAGSVALGEDDPIAPALVDVATWAGDGFSNTTATARAFHARHRDLARAAEATSRSDAKRSRQSLELCWHAMLAGGDAVRELGALERKRPEGALGEAFDALARRVGRIRK